MPTQEVKRKLTAILSADVKGYSRLMGADEEGTLRTLTAYREAMATLIQQDNGRVVNAPGDALLAEFESVVDAVRSAVEIQCELAKRNAELPIDRRMEYRIGINLGDVMVDGDSIYGDGVNISARLESLADAGGICISGTVYDHVKNKLQLGYEYRGEQTVKNIVEPIRVYKVLMEPEAAGKVIGEMEFHYSRKQSDSTPLARPTCIGNSAMPSGLRVDLKRRLPHTKKQFSLRLITFIRIFSWRLLTFRWVEKRRPTLKLPRPSE